MELSFTVTCKKCGHEHGGAGPRPRDDAACPGCGAVYAKVEAAIAAAQASPAKPSGTKVPLTLARKVLAAIFALAALGGLLLPHLERSSSRRSGRYHIIDGLVQALGPYGARVALFVAFAILCIAVIVMRPSTSDDPKDEEVAWRWPWRRRRQYEPASGEWIVSAMTGIVLLSGAGIFFSLLGLNLGAAFSIFGVALAALAALLVLGLAVSVRNGVLFFSRSTTWRERPITFALGVIVPVTLLVLFSLNMNAQQRSPESRGVEGDTLQVEMQRGWLPWSCPDLTGIYLWDKRASVAGQSSGWLWRHPLGISPERAELEFSGPTERTLTIVYREMPPNKDRGVNSNHAGRHRYSVRCDDGWVELRHSFEAQQVRVEMAFGLTTHGHLISRQARWFDGALTVGNARLELGDSTHARYAVHERLSAPMNERPLSDREWAAWKSGWNSEPAPAGGPPKVP